jgi:hypothetical protein
MSTVYTNIFYKTGLRLLCENWMGLSGRKKLIIYSNHLTERKKPIQFE